MVLLEHQGKVGYNLDKKEHPLDVELGYAHFARNGEKDFLRKVTGYEIRQDGILLAADTYHERTALVKVTFSGETVCFRRAGSRRVQTRFSTLPLTKK